MQNLTQSTLRAVLWNFTGTLGTQAVQLVVNIIMARLISPAEFGLVAVLTVFVALAAVLVESGFGGALIQKQQTTPAEESSIFYLNLAVALVMTACFFGLAPFIAQFYREPLLAPIARVMSLSFPLSAAGLIQTSLFARRLDFRSQGIATVTAMIVSGVLGITMALHGGGVWSLVAQSVSAAAVRSLVLWLLSPWRPVPAFDVTALRAMFQFGSRLMFSSLLSTVFSNLYPLVIGKLFTRADLGFYARAVSTQRLAATSLTSNVCDVTFPAYSALQDDQTRLREGYRRTVIAISLLAFPFLFGLAAIARPLIRVIYSDVWLPSAPIFQVLCLAGSFYHLHALNLDVLKAMGKSGLFLRLEIFKVILTLAAVLATFRLGLMAMIWGQVVTSVVCLFVNARYTRQLINYGIGRQCIDLWPIMLLAGAAATTDYYVGAWLFPQIPAVQLILMIVLMLGLFLGPAYAFDVRGTRTLYRAVMQRLRRTPADRMPVAS